MNPIVEIQGSHSSTVWLIVIDEKIWGYVDTADSVKSAFNYLAEKFIADIKKANPSWNVEAIQKTETHMQIKCVQPGFVYNSEWIAHNFTAQQLKMYKEPNDNQSPILIPFPSEKAPEQDDLVIVPEEKPAAPVVEEIETKLAEMVVTAPPKVESEPIQIVKKGKKRSRQNSPVSSFGEKAIVAIETIAQKIEPLAEVIVDKIAVPAIEQAVERVATEYIPAVATPLEIQLDKPTHPPIKKMTNSFEKRIVHSAAHISKYPQTRLTKKK